ncbi:MAG: polysaccharide biosynthesis tyrosine autokinase [Planctomycetes bacterium]|nr:polysaccharide biosynthesis tyrosine autokinase [Planctomycetota bacterium]
MTLVPTREEAPQVLRYAGMSSRRPAGTATGSQSGLTASDIMRILRRRMWLIIISLIVFTGAAIGGTIVWRQTKPIYKAQALIEVQPPTPSVMHERGMQQSSKEIMERTMYSAAQSIRTEKVLLGAAENIRGTAWFQEQVDAKQDVITKLRQEVSVSPIPQTNLLQVSMSGTNQSDITEIANAVANAAVSDVKDTHRASLLATIDQLTEERKDLRRERDENQAVIERLQKSGIGSEAVEAMEVLRYQAANLVSTLTEVSNEYIAAYNALNAVTGRTEEELADMPEVRYKLDMDRGYITLQQNVIQLEQEMAHVENRFPPGHRTYRNIRSRLDKARSMLEAKREDVIRRSITELKEMRQSAVAALQQQYLEVKKKLKEVQDQLKAREEMVARLEAAERAVEKAELTLQNLDSKILDLRLVMQSKQPLMLHRRAPKPREIDFPTYTVMVPVGVFLGLVVGLGITFLLELTDTSIKAPSDVARKVELPMLGMIPHLDDVEEDIPDLRLAFMTTPDTIVSEAFRQVRTTLMFSGPADQRRSILVTSPMPEDGRTSVSLNLGHAIANGGRSVLVIDANFRQPIVRKLFPMCPDGGLSSCLSEQANWRELTYEIEPNIYVMAAGPIPPNPAELLGSEKMRQLLTEFQGEFDQIIFDGAPCLVVSDAAVLSTIVDGTVLAVRAGVSTYGIVQRTRDMLNKLGSHIFGVVLNGVRVTAGGYLRKNYETFYEYRESPQLAAVGARDAEGASEGNAATDLSDLAEEVDDG